MQCLKIRNHICSSQKSTQESVTSEMFSALFLICFPVLCGAAHFVLLTLKKASYIQKRTMYNSMKSSLSIG